MHLRHLRIFTVTQKTLPCSLPDWNQEPHIQPPVPFASNHPPCILADLHHYSTIKITLPNVSIQIGNPLHIRYKRHPCSSCRLLNVTMGTERDSTVELVLFSCRECYVYAPIPAAGTIGHRAELWNVEKWAKEVSLKAVTCNDELFVRLSDMKTNELFAECPVNNKVPVSTAVEPVVDSSRYYVLKVVDRDSGRHAFIGLGFRDRNESADFSAALSDHRQYLKRKDEAEVMHKTYEAEDREEVDYRLKPGETIRVNIPQASRTDHKRSPHPNLMSEASPSGSTDISVPVLAPAASHKSHTDEQSAVANTTSATSNTGIEDPAGASVSVPSNAERTEHPDEEYDDEGWGSFVGSH